MIDKKTEALKLALEALEANQPVNYCMNNNGEKFPMMQEDPFRFERNSKAITALREALAEQPAQQQEPVAKVVTDNSRELVVESLNSKYLRKGTKLYTSPPASKPWVGLTDEEISARALNFYNPEMYKRAVLWAQEKLKERNK